MIYVVVLLTFAVVVVLSLVAWVLLHREALARRRAERRAQAERTRQLRENDWLVLPPEEMAVRIALYEAVSTYSDYEGRGDL